MKTSILLIGALVLGGCASSRATRQPTTGATGAARPATRQQPGMHGGMMSGDMAGMCPTAVEGATARAEEVAGGAAIVFTTPGDVSALRERVARMAEMHNHHHGEGHAHGMGMQGGMGMMGGAMTMPPSAARSEDVEGGARLVFTPRDPADLAKLRAHVGQHAEMMASGRCPMMSMPGQGAEAAPSRESSEHESHHPADGK